MIDYKIYNTSIEALGQSLLADFQPSANRPIEPLATTNYFRWNARSYAVYWSSNPSPTSQCGTTLRRDTTKWNPSYQYLWDANDTIRCNNCADYVSQALRNGALPTDSTWNPSLASAAWVGVNALRDYLDNKYAGVYFISFSSLQVGDLTIIPSQHVAMVTNVNPHQVSGHTNDRVNYGIGPTTYTQFLHISDYP
jgi:hypothetical protein